MENKFQSDWKQALMEYTINPQGLRNKAWRNIELILQG